MEPNNNMGGNNPLGGESVISEQVVTEQVTETPMSPAAAPEKKKNNGMLLGLILCLLLAAGGVGFGVWAMMDGNSQKDALNNQMNTLKQQNDELMEQVGDGDTIINIDTDTDVDTEDYIYVGEWGLKIKIPEGLNIVNYSLSESGYGEHLSVSGAKEKINGVVPVSASLDASAGSIVRSNSDDGFYPYGSLVYTDSVGNKYYYEGPQAYPDLSENELKLWKETQVIIQGALTNPENFSAI